MIKSTGYDVLLVFPKEKQLSHSDMIPLGIASIAAVLEKNGYHVKIVDFNYYKGNFTKDLVKWNPEVIGIGGTTNTRKQSFKIAREAKKANPDYTVVYGGIHATFAAGETLSNISSIDYVIKGEGEFSFLKLCNKIIRNEGKEILSIDGLCCRSNGRIIENKAKRINSLGNLPIPARHLFDNDYSLKLDFFDVDAAVLITSRGCPVNCSFCSASKMFPGGVRLRPMESVKEEIDSILTRKKIGGLKIFDSTFTADRDHVTEFCRFIKPYNLLWECEIRADTVDYTLLSIMKDAGCCYVDLGLETTNEKLLKGINKQISVLQAEQALEWCKKLDIKTKVFFIFGHLGQTFNECLKDIKWLKLHRKDIDYFANSIGLKLFPGTLVEKQAKKKNIIPPDFSWTKYKPSLKNLLLLEFSDVFVIYQKQLSILKLVLLSIILTFSRINLNPSRIVHYSWKILRSTGSAIIKVIRAQKTSY